MTMPAMNILKSLRAMSMIVIGTQMASAMGGDGTVASRNNDIGERLVNGSLHEWREGTPVGWEMANCREIPGFRTVGKALRFEANGSCAQKVNLQAGQAYRLELTYRIPGVGWKFEGVKGTNCARTYGTPYWHRHPYRVVETIVVDSVDPKGAVLKLFGPVGSSIEDLSLAPYSGGFTGAVIAEAKDGNATVVFGAANNGTGQKTYRYKARLLNFFLEPIAATTGEIVLKPGEFWSWSAPFKTGTSKRHRAELSLVDAATGAVVEDVAFLEGNEIGQFRKSFRINVFDFCARPRSAPDPEPGQQAAKVSVPHEIQTPGENGFDCNTPYDPETNYWGVYEAAIALPETRKDQRVLVDLASVANSPQVFLNGIAVGGAQGRVPLVVDATAAAKPGAVNALRIRAASWKAGYERTGEGENLRQMITLPYAMKGGIVADVWARVVPAIRVEGAFIRTSFRKKSVTIEYTIVNDTQHSQVVDLVAEVLGEGTSALTLPSASLLVRGQEREKVTVEAAWENPRLWMPRAPYLYRLRTNLAIGGTQVDEHNERFGFREVWTEGKKIVWNGENLKLATRLSRPRPDHANIPVTPDSSWRALQQYAEGGIWFGRGFAFEIEGIDRDELCDEMGFVVRHELQLDLAFNDWRKQVPADGEYWQLMAEHTEKPLVKVRNHPCVLCVSMENETFLCGSGDHWPWLFERYARLRAIARATIPGVLLEHDGSDPNGDCDIINTHYAFNPARTMPYQNAFPAKIFAKDAWYGLQLYPGSLVWNEQRPLVMGEDFIGFAETPQTLSLLNDEDVYDVQEKNPRLGIDEDAFDRAYHRLHESFMQAARKRELAYITTWPITDTGWADTLQPEAIFVEEPFRHLWSGEKVALTATVHHDLLERLDGTLAWTFTGANGHILSTDSADLDLVPGGVYTVPMRLKAASVEVPTNATLHLELKAGKRILATRTCDFTLYPKTAPAKAGIVLHDPKGETATAFKRRSIAFTGGAPAVGQLFVIGKDALVDNATFDAAPLLAFAEAGGRVLVMEQQGAVPEWLPVRLTTNLGHHSFAAFPRAPGHPVLAGLSAEAFSFWRGPGARVSADNYWKPRGSNLVSIIDTGTIGGYLTTALAELPLGQGSILLSQVELTSNLGVEPVADMLMDNLLRYSTVTPFRTVNGGLSAKSPPLAEAARKAGITVVDDGASVILLDGSALVFAEIAQALAEAASGKTVWVNGMTEATAPAWAAAGLTGLALTQKAMPNIVKKADAPLLAGLSNSDLFFAGIALAPMPGEYTAGGGANLIELACQPPSLPGTKELLANGALVEVPFGKGRILLDNTAWPKLIDSAPQRGRRLPCVLATNLGLEVRQVGEDIPCQRQAQAFTAIDISSVHNERLNDVLGGHPGTFGGVPFTLKPNAQGALLLGSKILTMPEPRLTTASAMVPVDAAFDAVYLLITAYNPYEGGRGYGSGEVFGGVYFQMVDGSVEYFPLLHKVHAVNLFENMGDLACGKLVWSGPTPFAAWWDLYTRWPGNRWIQREHPNNLYLVRWLNPTPARKIKGVTFHSSNLHVVPVIIGMTGAKF
jgi:hypothetical protein